MIDVEKSRVESLTKELYVCREELRHKTQDHNDQQRKLSELEGILTIKVESLQKANEMIHKQI